MKRLLASMFNMGVAIGIVSHNISKSGGSDGLGFVVTINSAQKLLVEGKTFWSALQGMILTGRLATIFNVPAPAGFLVKTVAQGSTAWNMGLLGSDGIVTIGGQEIAVGGDTILSVDGIPIVSEGNIEKIRNKLARTHGHPELGVGGRVDQCTERLRFTRKCP